MATETKYTREEIEQAVNEGRALLIWAHGNWANAASLWIYETVEDADIDEEKCDTVGQCHSMGDETWTERPTVAEAIRWSSGSWHGYRANIPQGILDETPKA